MAVSGEKAAAVLPEQRPDPFAVRLRDLQLFELPWRKEFESTFVVCGGQARQLPLDFEQEHQPVGLAFVTVLADNPRQVQTSRCHLQADFLPGFATGAGVGRLADLSLQISAARAPQTTVWFFPVLH